MLDLKGFALITDSFAVLRGLILHFVAADIVFRIFSSFVLILVLSVMFVYL